MSTGFVSIHAAWLQGACFVGAIGFAVLTVWQRVRSQRVLAVARRALEVVMAEARAKADVVFGGRPDVLVCQVCLCMVPLADRPVVRCRHCGASVPIPRSFLDLVRAQADRTPSLERDAKELCRLVAAGRPAWAYALAGVDARGLARRFAAAPAPVGFACRICGAALVEEQDGRCEVCAYCSAENVVLSRLAGASRETAEGAWALGACLAVLRAERGAFVWTAAQIPALFLAAMAGALLLAAICW